MEHPDEGLIHAWLDGALPDDEAASLEAHVVECESCKAAVAEARGFIAASSRIVSALDDVPGDVIPRDRPGLAAPRAVRPSWWKQRGIAAAALLFVVASSAVLTRGRGDVVTLATPALSMASDSVASAAPSELKVAMDQANERDQAERAAAAPVAAMSAPAARPAAPPRSTSPVVGVETSSTPTAALVAVTVTAVSDSSAARAAGAAASTRSTASARAPAAAVPGAPAAASAQNVDPPQRASDVAARGRATAGAPSREALPPAASPQFAPLVVAPAAFAGCYAVAPGPNAPAAQASATPRRMQLTDSLSTGAERWYLARALDRGAADRRLSWSPTGAETMLLRVMSAGDTTQVRLRVQGSRGVADGVATRQRC